MGTATLRAVSGTATLRAVSGTATLRAVSGTVKADCGCLGTVRHQTRLAVYVHVTVPCEQGHPERVAAGVLWPFRVGEVHAPTSEGVL